jgi:hypothetical protein
MHYNVLILKLERATGIEPATLGLGSSFPYSDFNDLAYLAYQIVVEWGKSWGTFAPQVRPQVLIVNQAKRLNLTANPPLKSLRFSCQNRVLIGVASLPTRMLGALESKYGKLINQLTLARGK